MEMEQNTPQVKRSFNYKVTAIVVIAVSMLLVAATSVGLVLGYLNIGKQDTSRIVSVCDPLVGSYNKVVVHDVLTERAAMYKDVASKVSDIEGNEADPTCLYMRYFSAHSNGQAEEVKRLGGILLKLADEGSFMTSEVSNVASPVEIKRILDIYNEGVFSGSSSGSEEGRGNG